MTKPKPATVGEREEMRRFKLTLDEVRSSGHAKEARRIDAVVKKAFTHGESSMVLLVAGGQQNYAKHKELRAKYGVKGSGK